jgi:hypothetical protein
LASELCQIVGDELFFYWHTFLELGKTQDLPSKIWQTLEDAHCHLPQVGKKQLRVRIYVRSDPRHILPDQKRWKGIKIIFSQDS